MKVVFEMIISYIECYKNIIIRYELLEHKVNRITDFFVCSFYVDNKLIEAIQTFEINKCISDIQKELNRQFLEKHPEYIEKIDTRKMK